MARCNLSNRMYDHYCAWQSSGLSQRSYSKENGLTMAQFHYWVGKFRSGQPPAEPEESGFLPLVVSSGDTAPVFEINYSSGHRISFYQLVEVTFIQDLLV